MATSGSTNFTQTRDEIILDALILLGVVGTDQSVSSEDSSVCTRSLNRMIKSWQMEGIHLFGEEQATIFLVPNQKLYNLNTSSGDHASISVVETTLSAAEAASQTELSITSTAGMTASDNVGIELTDGTRQWTTITSVDSATQITVDDALDSAAASGNTVYSYTTKLDRPLYISDIRRRDLNGYDSPVYAINKTEYYDRVNKAATGSVLEITYDPKLSVGKLHVWPTSDNVKDRLKITYFRALEDVDSGTDNFDFPVEWLDAIVYNLALRIAPIFNRIDQVNIIGPLATNFLNNALNANTQGTSFSMTPNMQDY